MPTFRISTVHTLLLTLALSSAPALSQQTSANNQAIEEITITGNEARVNLQLAIDQAEDDFYALFNQLIDDEDFEVTCSLQQVLGTRIKQRICQTRYQQKELTRAAKYTRRGMAHNADAGLAVGNRKLKEMALELLETNAELRSSARNLTNLVEEYNDKYLNPE